MTREMTPQDITLATYDSVADSYAEVFREPVEHLDLFMQEIKPNGHILDFGCGPGVEVTHMMAHGFSVHGVDGSSRMISKAAEANPGASFEQARFETFTPKPKSYDAVLASQSLTHIARSDIETVMHRLTQGLRKGGAFALFIHFGPRQEILIPEPLDPTKMLFLSLLTKDDIHSLLKTNGYTVLHETIRCPEGPGELGYDRICVICRKT